MLIEAYLIHVQYMNTYCNKLNSFNNSNHENENNAQDLQIKILKFLKPMDIHTLYMKRLNKKKMKNKYINGFKNSIITIEKIMVFNLITTVTIIVLYITKVTLWLPLTNKSTQFEAYTYTISSTCVTTNKDC
ncbi:hypothetical protein H8356DRAFT_1418641 [Neocallimastix lanati (nom. inval.)]|nr:hypothetical protein H8356DRAFT_1418641 [Neocallimastix sp. JGI-2020a]